MLASLAIALALSGAPAAKAEPGPLESAVAHSPLMQMPAPTEPLPGARTGQDVLSNRMPPYPNAPAPDRVGETLETNGVPMNIQSFTTPDDPRTVLAFYKQAFEAAHLPMLGDGDLLVRFPYPSVSAFDDANQVDLIVVAMRDEPHKLTTVLLTLADIQGLQSNVARAVREKFGPLPAYPGVDAPHTLVSNEGELKTVMVTFATSDAPDKVLGFYAGELGKQGFKPTAGARNGELSVASDQAAWHMAVRRDEKKNQTLVNATWSNRNFEEAAP